MTCFDAINDYSCVCYPEKGCKLPNNSTLNILEQLTTWNYALYGIAVLVPLAIASGVLIYCCIERMNKKKAMKKKQREADEGLVIFIYIVCAKG